MRRLDGSFLVQCLLTSCLLVTTGCGAGEGKLYWPEPEEVPVYCTGRLYATELLPLDGLASFVFTDRVPDSASPDESWFASEDGGKTFGSGASASPVATADGTLVDLAYMHGMPHTPDDPSLASSSDGGVTWQLIESSPEMIRSLYRFPDGTLFAINSSPYPQLFRSDDGLNWTWLSPPKFRQATFGEDAIYLHGIDQPGLIRSKDKGASWQAIEPQDGDLYSASPAWRVAAGTGGHVVFVPADGAGWPFEGCDMFWGLWRSEDYGDTWVNDLWFGIDTPTPCNAGRPREVVVGEQDRIWLIWDRGRSAFDTFVPLQIWSSDNWGESWRYMKPTYKGWTPEVDPPPYGVVPAATANGLVYRLDVDDTAEYHKTVWCELGGKQPAGFDAVPAPVQDVAEGEIGLAVRFGSGLSSYGLMVTQAGEGLRWEAGATLISGLPGSEPWWDMPGDDWILRGAGEGGIIGTPMWYVLVENFKTGKRTFMTLDDAHKDSKVGYGVEATKSFPGGDGAMEEFQIIGMQIDHYGTPWMDTDKGMQPLKVLQERTTWPEVSKFLPADSALSRFANVAWVFSYTDELHNERWVNRIDLPEWDGVMPCDTGVASADCAPASGWWGRGAVDADDRLYFVDRSTHSVVRWDPAAPENGWQPIADGFRGPQAVVVDIQDPDKLWILDDDLYLARPKDGVVIRRHD